MTRLKPSALDRSCPVSEALLPSWHRSRCDPDCSAQLRRNSQRALSKMGYSAQPFLYGRMRRRKFIDLVFGAAAWPLAARAQQGERTRRIGILGALAADDPEGQAGIAAFLGELQQLGWSERRNLRVEYRWGTGDARHRA